MSHELGRTDVTVAIGDNGGDEWILPLLSRLLLLNSRPSALNKHIIEKYHISSFHSIISCAWECCQLIANAEIPDHETLQKLRVVIFQTLISARRISVGVKNTLWTHANETNQNKCYIFRTRRNPSFTSVQGGFSVVLSSCQNCLTKTKKDLFTRVSFNMIIEQKPPEHTWKRRFPLVKTISVTSLKRPFAWVHKNRFRATPPDDSATWQHAQRHGVSADKLDLHRHNRSTLQRCQTLWKDKDNSGLHILIGHRIHVRLNIQNVRYIG